MGPSAPYLHRAPAGLRVLGRNLPTLLDRARALPCSLLAAPNSRAVESFPWRRPVEGGFPPFVHRLPTGLPAHSVDRDRTAPCLPNSKRSRRSLLGLVTYTGSTFLPRSTSDEDEYAAFWHDRG